MAKAARKHYRWETGRAIVRHMLPTLPGPYHVSIILYCWFHAHGQQNEFRESAETIARHCGMSVRQVRRVMTDLERAGCIETIKPGCGQWAAVRQIKRQLYKKPTTNRGMTITASSSDRHGI